MKYRMDNQKVVKYMALVVLFIGPVKKEATTWFWLVGIVAGALPLVSVRQSCVYVREVWVVLCDENDINEWYCSFCSVTFGHCYFIYHVNLWAIYKHIGITLVHYLPIAIALRSTQLMGGAKKGEGSCFPVYLPLEDIECAKVLSNHEISDE